VASAWVPENPVSERAAVVGPELG